MKITLLSRFYSFTFLSISIFLYSSCEMKNAEFTTVSGVVVDYFTGEPLANVGVGVFGPSAMFGNDDSCFIDTISDENGAFYLEFENPGTSNYYVGKLFDTHMDQSLACHARILAPKSISSSFGIFEGEESELAIRVCQVGVLKVVIDNASLISNYKTLEFNVVAHDRNFQFNQTLWGPTEKHLLVYGNDTLKIDYSLTNEEDTVNFSDQFCICDQDTLTYTITNTTSPF